MDKIEKKKDIIFFSTFWKITVGGFLNQLIKKFWPKQTVFLNVLLFCILNLSWVIIVLSLKTLFSVPVILGKFF